MTNLKSVFTFLLLATFVVVFASGCKEDLSANEQLNNRLAGDWDVESFTIDGVELMQSEISSFTMEFTKQGAEDGETDWRITANGGNSGREEYDYSIENDGQEIDIDGDDFDIDLDGDELELDANIDSERISIRAERD